MLFLFITVLGLSVGECELRVSSTRIFNSSCGKKKDLRVGAPPNVTGISTFLQVRNNFSKVVREKVKMKKFSLSNISRPFRGCVSEKSNFRQPSRKAGYNCRSQGGNRKFRCHRPWVNFHFCGKGSRDPEEEEFLHNSWTSRIFCYGYLELYIEFNPDRTFHISRGARSFFFFHGRTFFFFFTRVIICAGHFKSIPKTIFVLDQHDLSTPAIGTNLIFENIPKIIQWTLCKINVEWCASRTQASSSNFNRAPRGSKIDSRNNE